MLTALFLSKEKESSRNTMDEIGDRRGDEGEEREINGSRRNSFERDCRKWDPQTLRVFIEMVDFFKFSRQNVNVLFFRHSLSQKTPLTGAAKHHLLIGTGYHRWGIGRFWLCQEIRNRLCSDHICLCCVKFLQSSPYTLFMTTDPHSVLPEKSCDP